MRRTSWSSHRGRIVALAGLAAVTLVASSGSALTAAPAADRQRERENRPPAIASTASAGAGTVYVANETSGTISVLDAASGAVTHTICLGSDPAIPGTPQPNGPCNAEADHHKPFYDGHLAPHGLWLTPDGAILLVTNRLSGTVVAIDTATREVLGYTPVGREPHLATVRPGGREAWVAVRGEHYVEVLKLDRDDLRRPGLRPTERMERIATVDTALGPSMVTFTSDGKSAFVAAGKQALVEKIHADSRGVVASQALSVPFTPFGLVTPDDRELYLVHKSAGTLSILSTDDLSVLARDLPVGPRANHVAFVGKLAYVTVGGPAPSANAPDPEGKIAIVDRVTRAVVHELTGAAWTGDPHGIWASADGRRLFVGHERGNRLTIVDTGNLDDPRDDVVVGTVTDGAMKQPIDVVVRP